MIWLSKIFNIIISRKIYIWNLDIVQSTALPYFKIKGEEFKIRRCLVHQLSVERFWMTRYSE